MARLYSAPPPHLRFHMDDVDSFFGGAVSDASAKVNDYTSRTVGKHPMTSALLIAGLVLLLILVIYYREKYRKAAGKSGFNGSNIGATATTASGHKYPGFDLGPFLTPCTGQWDPAASAEAEALATAGGLPQENYAACRLQKAVDTAYDTGYGLTDDQLSVLMHDGGTP